MNLFILILIPTLSLLLVLIYLYIEEQPHRIKERFVRKVADEISHVLTHNFELGASWIEPETQRFRYSRIYFHEPLWQCVTLLAPFQEEPEEFDPDSPPGPKLRIWQGWFEGWVEFEVWRVTLEVNLNRLPYHTTTGDLLRKAADIEEHLSIVLGATVKIENTPSRYGNQGVKISQRLVFKVIYRERKKRPYNFERTVETTAADWQAYNQYLRDQQQKEFNERQLLIAEMLHVSLTFFDGNFAVKRIQAQFADQASHRTVEDIAKELEIQGLLLPGGGRKARRVNPEAQEKLEAYLNKRSPGPDLLV